MTKNNILVLAGISLLSFGFRSFPGGPGDYAPVIKKQLETMSQALVKKDFKTYIKYAHPNIIKEMGGETAMADTLKAYFSKMEKRGISIYDINNEDPSWVVDTAGELQCTVFVTTEMKVEGGFVKIQTTFVGVSKDKGANWVFIDTSVDYRTVRKEFPTLSSKLIIPEPPKPVFEKG